jgi:cytochrome c
LVTTNDPKTKKKEKTIGNYWPYATTIFDYVRRAMPFNQPGSLSNQEVYHLTAYLLHANGIIDEKKIIDAQTLPKIEMPNHKAFVPDDRTGGPIIR